VEVEVQEMLGLVALQWCNFKKMSYIMCSHGATIRAAESGHTQAYEWTNVGVLRVSCDTGSQKYPLQLC
jgi:hypothetical protein